MNSDLLGSLAAGFVEHANGTISLEAVQDQLRLKLHRLRVNDFRYGQFTSLTAILHELLTTQNQMIVTEYTCPQNHTTDERLNIGNFNCLLSAGNNLNNHATISEWIINIQEQSCQQCMVCGQQLMMLSKFNSIPELLAIDFAGKHPQIDPCIYLYKDGTPYKFMLKGVMYYGSGHFTSRIARSDNHTWYHDGVNTGVNTEYEGVLASLGDLMNCQGKLATVVLYVQEQVHGFRS